MYLLTLLRHAGAREMFFRENSGIGKKCGIRQFAYNDSITIANVGAFESCGGQQLGCRRELADGALGAPLDSSGFGA